MKACHLLGYLSISLVLRLELLFNSYVLGAHFFVIAVTCWGYLSTKSSSSSGTINSYVIGTHFFVIAVTCWGYLSTKSSSSSGTIFGAHFFVIAVTLTICPFRSVIRPTKRFDISSPQD